jgi:hypothetical protein
MMFYVFRKERIIPVVVPTMSSVSMVNVREMLDAMEYTNAYTQKTNIDVHSMKV